MDRAVCPIDIYSEYDMRGLSESAMLQVSKRIGSLQQALSVALSRPSLVNPAFPHESYLSLSREGSFLKRHLDERHEGLKHRKAWLLPSRRSVSWLLYLTEPGWDKGGEFRAFPPHEFSPQGSRRSERSGSKATYAGVAGCHEDDLQVGWLRRSSTTGPMPVYMDSWRRSDMGQDAPSEQDDAPIPLSALYILRSRPKDISTSIDASLPDTGNSYANTNGNDSDSGNSVVIDREYITTNFDADVTTDFSLTDILSGRFDTSHSSLFLTSKNAKGFSLIEDPKLWQEGQDPAGSGRLDVAPLRGRLVLFDSVALPHEVNICKLIVLIYYYLLVNYI